MEGISRKDIDDACEILTNRGCKKLADKIQSYDIIPKLYAYSYFKSVNNTLKELKGEDKRIDREDLEATLDNHSKLELEFLLDSAFNSNVKKLMEFLENGFKREGQFCDFNDSKFHSVVRGGCCQCEDHDEDDQQEYELTAVYQSDEFSHKWEDDPEWWCEACSSNCDSSDFDVSCDLDMEL